MRRPQRPSYGAQMDGVAIFIVETLCSKFSARIPTRKETRPARARL